MGLQRVFQIGINILQIQNHTSMHESQSVFEYDIRKHTLHQDVILNYKNVFKQRHRISICYYHKTHNDSQMTPQTQLSSTFEPNI